jgi:adenylate cyclase
VVAHLEALGIPAEALAGALASGHLSLGYLESAGRRHPRSEQTFAEVADQIGLPVATLARIYVAFGLLRPSPGERVLQEDLEVLGMLPVLLGAGVDEAQVLRLVRVWGDGARRIAQYLTHYFHATVEEQFRQRGMRDNEAYEAAIREVGLRMGRSGEDLLGWLFRRHSEVFMTEHQLGHVETALEDAGVRPRAPRQLEAVAFADLSGYTRLTEESGDEVAAEVSLDLAQLVSEVAAEHGGNLVKLLGDGAYLHFRDPGDAIRTSLAIVEGTVPRGLPPAHVGVNAGPLLYDEGDYFGRTVNVAARIGSQAGPGQVYVGEDAAGSVGQDGFRLVEVGRLELKGIAEPVGVFEAIREGRR